MLTPEKFKAAAEGNSEKIKVNLRIQDGYNHSYFFVSTFIADHFAHHARVLQNNSSSQGN
jgi:S-formylglutathione hydrolase